MLPTSASRPDHKLAPVRRECLFLRLLLNELLLFCYDSFYCCFVIIFCCYVDGFILLSLLSFCIFLQNLCSSELIKDGNKERLRQLVPPTHRRVYLALQNKQLLCKIWQLVPPHGHFGRLYLALLHSRCHLSFLKHFVKIRF